jgi:YVTN family beta-propeller protein
MRQINHTFIVLLLSLLAGCVPARIAPKPALTEMGELIIYLQPLPQEAQRLRFGVEGIYAIPTDASEIPLSLSVHELRGVDLTGRQKLLATGTLPPASYKGLAIKFKNAFVQSEEGEIALLIPEEPLLVPLVFEMVRRKALTLFLTLNPSGAITSAIHFTPGFSLKKPGRILINLTGYVSNSDSNLVSVFDKQTTRVVNTIATGWGPKGMALDQKRARAYVAISRDDAIEVYDVFKGDMINSLRLNLGDEPIDLALTPDGRTLVSVNHSSNTLSIIDPISMFEITRVQVGQGPTSVAVDPSGFKAYVMNTSSSTISVVDLTQRTVSVTIGVEGSPLQGAFNPAGDNLYVITRDTANLLVIDPSRLTLIRKIFVGTGALSLKVDFSTGLVLVGKKFGGEITVVEPSSSMFIDTIEVKGKAAFMTIDRQEHTLFVILPGKRLLQKINLTSKRIVAEIDLYQGAYQVVVMGEN